MAGAYLDHWYGDLCITRPTKYLVARFVSREIFVTVLVLYASTICSSATWLLLSAEPRASALNGFEMCQVRSPVQRRGELVGVPTCGSSFEGSLVFCQDMEQEKMRDMVALA